MSDQLNFQKFPIDFMLRLTLTPVILCLVVKILDLNN